MDDTSMEHPQMSVEDARKIGPPKPHRNTRKNIPLEDFLYLKVEKKLSDVDIAKILGCSPRNVGKRLEKIRKEWNKLPTHKKFRADILTHHQRRLLSGLTDKKIREMKGGEITKAHGELYGAERLERGQSTANVHTYRETLLREKEIEKELAEVNREMGEVEVRGVRLLPMEV